MALSKKDLENMADVVINNANGPVHVGSGDQINTTDSGTTTPAPVLNGSGITIVNGDNPGGIRQTFRRR